MTVLAVIVAAVLIVDRVVAFGGDDDAVEPAAKTADKPNDDRQRTSERPVRAASQASMGLQLDRLADRGTASAAAEQGASSASLFAAQSWLPAEAVVEVQPPPPRPVAPPFAYTYIGGLSDDGVRTSFFTRGERVLPVRVGDTIDAVFRVESMNDMQMTLTYLPLNEPVTIVFGPPP